MPAVGAIASFRPRLLRAPSNGDRRTGAAGPSADLKVCRAHTAVSPVGDLCPPGVVLSRSVLSGWVDACCRLLAPLDEALQHYVLTDGKLHADDTPVPVLLPGNKKTKTGRLWTYVRDDRNAGSALAPQCGSLTARTEKVSTLRPILQASVAYCRLMPTPGSTSSTATAI